MQRHPINISKGGYVGLEVTRDSQVLNIDSPVAAAEQRAVVLAELESGGRVALGVPTCWVLSIIASASAISFWFMPHRLATFVWHR